MNIPVLAGYLHAAMIAWSPIAAHDYTGVSRAETDDRYWSIAYDLEIVAGDPDEKPLFDGPTGRAQTALLMLAIASYESGGFRWDVDRQDKPTGDGGHAWCLAQVHDPYARELVKLGPDGRISCFRAELHALRDSWNMCKTDSWDVAYHLTGYTVGHCEAYEPESIHRAKRALTWWSAAPWLPPVD